MSDYDIRLADTDDDRAAAYRLRYELYVEQQGLFGDVADHGRRWLTDERDEHAILSVAEAQGVRVFFGSPLIPVKLTSWYQGATPTGRQLVTGRRTENRCTGCGRMTGSFSAEISRRVETKR